MYAPLTVFFALPVRGIHDNGTNMTGNYIYTTHMPLENEFKRKDNEIKGRNPPRKILKL
jgi:hypothetical protein